MVAHDRYLVTGVAGFIGSQLTEALLEKGLEVVGIDAFTPTYSRLRKEANLAAARHHPRFTLVEDDLLTADLPGILEGITAVIHLAGEAGVRSSWGEQFAPYLNNNVAATQRLLEAVRRSTAIQRFVYASSSSVYGDPAALPVTEQTVPHPRSPYGVTKLAAEHLCGLYATEFGVPAVSLRFFTVFGPRQRPDMGFHRFIDAILRGDEIVLFGDGEQTRDFTYVGDILHAVMAAADRDLGGRRGGVYNIGGGTRSTLRSVIGMLEATTGRAAKLRFRPAEPGDVRHTWADCTAARRELGYEPATDVRSGLAAQVVWQAQHLESASAAA